MEINILQKRLEIWKRILFINLGASVTLFVQAILIYQESGSLMFQTSWYGVWFVIQLASFLPGFVLLLGKHWMQIPLRERLNTIFGYFVITLLNGLPVSLRMDSQSADPLNIFFLSCAFVIGVAYWWLRRKSRGIQNEMFP